MKRFLLSLCVLATAFGQAFANDPAVIAPQNSLEKFWDRYDLAESNRIINEKIDEAAKAENSKKNADSKVDSLTTEQLESLEDSVEQLQAVQSSKASPAEKNTATVNLVQSLYSLSVLLKESDKKASDSAVTEAIDESKEVDTNVISSDNKHRLLYLRSLLFSANKDEKSSRQELLKLASESTPSKFLVYANITLGDAAFNSEDSTAAKSYYLKALSTQSGLRSNDTESELVQINHRLAWSAYRTGDLNDAIKFAVDSLKPGLRLDSDKKLFDIKRDACELIGNSLYEINDYDKIRSTLKKKMAPEYAAIAGTTILKRYNDAGLFEPQLAFNEFLESNFALSAELPLWLKLNAKASSTLKQTEQVYASYAKIASILPNKSLWREKNRDDVDAKRTLDKDGPSLTLLAAEYYYDQAVKSGSITSFTQSAAIYQSLIDFSANDPQSNQWRLREANCYYFSKNYDKATELYTNLINDKKLEKATLEIASYQLAMSSERQWRVAFAKQLEQKQPNEDAAKVEEAQKALENHVNAFANRFPNTQRSSDLLLVTAAAHRDSGRLPEARKYWERVLIAQPTPQQRAVAIRGLVLATVESKNSKELVSTVERFLKMENFAEVGIDLKNELEGVLSTAAIDEATKQNSNGNVEEAGLLLARTGEENSGIPKREKIIRDGAYMLALGGDWDSADVLAQKYLDQNLKQFEGDMMYLKARSFENQMRFAEAGKTYLRFYTKHPKHKQALTSIERAFNLSTAEDDLVTASKAAELLADRQSSADRAAGYLEYAHTNYLSLGNADEAIRIAKKLRQLSTEKYLIFKGDLLLVKAELASKNPQAGIARLESVSSLLKRSRSGMPAPKAQALTGEANYMLGKVNSDQFYDYKMSERSGTPQERIQRKTNYYEAMSKSFELAAASQSPEWSSHSRYDLALAAEAFADELAEFSKNNQKALVGRMGGYGDTVERLRRLSKRYHTENVLARSKNPNQYKDNQWVHLSSLRVRGSQSEPGTTDPEFSQNIVMPTTWSN